MTDPEPVKEEISEEAAGPVDETMDVPATTTSDEAGSPAVAAPDTASEKKRKNVLITIGVVVVIIIAAIGAFVLLQAPWQPKETPWRSSLPSPSITVPCIPPT